MISIRRADERGLAHFGWLHSRHTFSFGNYFDPRHMGFGPLRVINEDRVEPGRGFGEHGHRDMEIVTYVVEGALEHRDSLGTGSVLRPGDVQRMSAGRGVMHSEFNHEPAGETHFLQIWIEPNVRGIAPGYEARRFESAQKRGRLALVASADARAGSLKIHQDVSVYAGLFDGAKKANLSIAPGRRLYVHLARDELFVNGQRLGAGDAATFRDETAFGFERCSDAEVLVFDLP